MLCMVKGEHRFVFTYQSGQEETLIRELKRMPAAEDALDHADVDVLIMQVRREMKNTLSGFSSF